MNLMTKAEYAKHRGVSKPAVSKMVRQDRILLTDDGLVDQEISDLLLDQFSESPLQNPKPKLPANDLRNNFIERMSAAESYAESRALLTKYKAELARLEIEETQGKLLDRSSVESTAFATARRVRDSILNIPDRISSVLAAETDQLEIRKILSDELRKSLEELSNEFTSADTIH